MCDSPQSPRPFCVPRCIEGSEAGGNRDGDGAAAQPHLCAVFWEHQNPTLEPQPHRQLFCLQHCRLLAATVCPSNQDVGATYRIVLSGL